MKWFRPAAVAALLVLALGLVAFTPPAAQADPGKRHPVVRKILARTHVVVVHAFNAVKKGGEGRAAFRAAWIDQHAAWKALRHDKPILAARLSLLARAEARKAIQANKGEKLKEEEAKDAEAETKEAEGASQEEVDAAIKEEEKTAPSEEELLKEEPKAEEAE